VNGRRFLILSAGMGSGHDAVAGELATRLRTADQQTVQADVLELLPAGVGGALRGAYREVIEHLPVLYAGTYRAFFRKGSVPRPGSAPLAALAENRLLDLARRHRVDSWCRFSTWLPRSPGDCGHEARCRCPAPW
jgi:hypothetical protein